MLKGLFNFIFIWLLFFSSLGYTLYQLQRPEFLLNQARDARLYERLTGNIGSLLPKEEKDKLPFTDSEMKEIVTDVVDANTFYTFAGQASGTYLDWLTGRSQSLEFSYDLNPTKTKLTDEITAKLVAKYNALAECKSSQLKGWQATSGLPSCKLPSSNVQSADVERLFARQAQDFTANLPATLSLPEPNNGLLSVREKVMQGLRGIYIAWAVTFGFLLLYLLIFRSRAFLSLAIIFLLAGLLEIGFSLIGWEWLSRLLIDLFSAPGQNLVGLTADMAVAVAEILKTIMGNLSIASLSIGGVLLVLGIVNKVKRGATTVAKLG